MTNPHFKDVTQEQNHTNPFAKLVPGQTIVEIPELLLECGEKLVQFPVASKTWGKLNKDRDNVLLICHALTGSADVQDWWGPLLGTNKTFDPSRFFIICINFLGSPYGSASPVTIDKATGKPYGPAFPLVTVKDDLKVHRLILDSLAVNSIACVIGGSMGGMIALEYSATYRNDPYVKTVIALATAARASAWCISWNETQRQCIFADPYYDDGYYYENKADTKPDSGLSAARMAALLTYRSRNSFETRFGRKLPQSNSSKQVDSNNNDKNNNSMTVIYPKTKDEENWLLHNEGSRSSTNLKSQNSPTSPKSTKEKPQTYFTAQSYLRYQGNKFVNRFDANCYISITRKLDTHDITRGRVEEGVSEDPLPAFLNTLNQPHLIIGIESDGLFTFGEQSLLGANIRGSILRKLNSPEGHDAFLLEFELINQWCHEFLQEKLPEFYDEKSGKFDLFLDWEKFVDNKDNGGNSVFGEVENITNW